jgi:hypothetical protein|tara:strand:+ start:1356 stop:1967 length:612 start_codon:yes stop_codon:yes gene_type:complete
MGKSVKRGEYITSLTRLSSDLNIPVRQLRTSLKRLVKTGEIDTQTTNKYTKVTILNYDSYQVDEVKKKKEATRKRQTIDTQPTEISKNIRKKEDNKTMIDICKADIIWKETTAMHFSLTLSKIDVALDKFLQVLTITDEKKTSMRDLRTHFVNWMKYNSNKISTSNGDYKWKWKGQAIRSGTKAEMEIDKNKFDQKGFDFTIL